MSTLSIRIHAWISQKHPQTQAVSQAVTCILGPDPEAERQAVREGFTQALQWNAAGGQQPMPSDELDCFLKTAWWHGFERGLKLLREPHNPYAPIEAA